MRYLLSYVFILVAIVLTAGCIGPDDNGGTATTGSAWVSANLAAASLHVGEVQTIRGQVSGSDGPVLIAMYTIRDYNANNLSSPVLSDTVIPVSDGSYQYSFVVDPAGFTPGEYVVIASLPSGESIRLTFMVEAG
jgi:hypothetical protein